MGLAQKKRVSCSSSHVPPVGNVEAAQEKVGNTGRSRLKPAVGNRVLGIKDNEQASSCEPKVT